MKVGTISYEVRSGLGILARDFYDNGIVDRILIIEHPAYERQTWYAKDDRFELKAQDEFLKGLDALLLFENVFTSSHWQVVAKARKLGIKVVMMPMFEFTPKPLPVYMDLYICPSLLDVKYYENLPHKFIPVPVQRPWKLRERAKVFVHNAGHGGHKFRNGTPELIKALSLVKSPIELIVRAQPDSGQMRGLIKNCPTGDKRLRLVLRNVPDEELYSVGDVFIFPEKFNGLSLPLQEAYASGMLVMATNRFPMNTWLPEEPLIPTVGTEKMRCIPSVEIESAIIRPEDIAKKIDEFYNADITGYSVCGKYWAEKTSWDALKPVYLEALSKK